MAAKKTQKKNRGRTTTAAATAHSISTTLLGSVINMGVMAISSGSVLLLPYRGQAVDLKIRGIAVPDLTQFRDIKLNT